MGSYRPFMRFDKLPCQSQPYAQPLAVEPRGMAVLREHLKDDRQRFCSNADSGIGYPHDQRYLAYFDVQCNGRPPRRFALAIA
jgi:hypothetical protein